MVWVSRVLQLRRCRNICPLESEWLKAVYMTMTCDMTYTVRNLKQFGIVAVMFWLLNHRSIFVDDECPRNMSSSWFEYVYFRLSLCMSPSPVLLTVSVTVNLNLRKLATWLMTCDIKYNIHAPYTTSPSPWIDTVYLIVGTSLHLSITSHQNTTALVNITSWHESVRYPS